MSDESDLHGDRVDAIERDEGERAAIDGGIPLDAFWTRIDAIDA